MTKKRINMSQYHDKEYLKMVQYILENGDWKDNRTGVQTLSVFGYQMRFDLSDGSIPLLTTKKMHIRSIIHELLWYLMGTGDITYLHDNNVTIWNEWADNYNQLGPVYGVLWRAFPPEPYYKPINIKQVIDNTHTRSWMTSPPTRMKSGKHTGKICTNIQNLSYQIMGLDGTCENGIYKTQNTYTIMFEVSGWCKPHVSTTQVLKGNFVDQSLPSVYGVGILGDYRNKQETKENKQLRRIWENMISRCYNENDIAYETHGGRGVRVCNRWLVLSDFIHDVKQLPNWFVVKRNVFNGFVLDKDYYGDNQLYHPDTCAWISKEHNNMYRRDAKPIEIITETSHLYFPTESAAAKHIGTTPVAIRSRTSGKVQSNYNGSTITEFKDPKLVIRMPHHVDQIRQLVHMLKTLPNSRRLMLTSWHPGVLPDESIAPCVNATRGMQALPPCHFQIQCYVANGKLSMILNQRSCDVGLGVPFNIVQYSLLLRMLAHVTDLQPGEFIWNGGDVHIYQDHITDKLELQLTREPYESPTFEFARPINDIDSFQFNDFIIKGYTSHDKIDMKVAV